MTPQPGHPTSSAAQAGALLRKSATLQLRNKATNACLLAAPVFVCVLLLVVQVGITRLLSGPDFQCGCQCVKCCAPGAGGANCTVMADRACPATHTCLAFNASRCGLEYSVGSQGAFCAIPRPSMWPPIIQTPPEADRAAPFKPSVTVLHVPGADARLSAAMTRSLFTPPFLQLGTLLAVKEYLSSWSADMAKAFSLPGEVLAMLGLTRLGTTAKLPQQGGLVLDTALVGAKKSLELLWPDGTCARLGLQGTANVSIVTALQAMVNASNPPPAAALINARLQELAGSLSGTAAEVTRLAVNCSDVVLARSPSTAALQRTLYCGHRAAHCNGSTRAANSYAAAVEWRHTGGAAFAPALYYNDTYALPDDGGEYGASLVRSPQLLNMAVNAWLASVLGQNVSAELIGIGALPRLPWRLGADFTCTISAVLACWVLQLLMPVFVSQLVCERQQRLRMMMKMHGLRDGAYWAVHYAWFASLYAAFVSVFVLCGWATGLSLFTRNDLGMQLVLYVLWGHALIAASFFASCFFTSARTAAVACYLGVFASGLVGYMMMRVLLDLGPSGEDSWVQALQVIPQLALYRGLYELGAGAFLGDYRNSRGLTIASLADSGNGMRLVWALLAAEGVLLAALAWWLEQVYASGTGNWRHPLYFLGFPRPAKHQPAGASSAGAAAVWTDDGRLVRAEPADVVAERRRVAGLADYGAHPLVIRGLRKTYPTQDGQGPKLAVRCLHLAVAKGECVGLLGVNGAGKSTSLAMLTGLTEPTAGTAIIGGLDITDGRHMAAIYRSIGVCPQHDRLWGALTGREHLLFYGRLKGLTGRELEDTVASCLQAVRLWANGAADKPAGRYSGGMQRRLSVAISLMGDPRLVILDEPSTGLDPASRRVLWDVITSAKAGRAIVLTTHSMEEAEHCCDRLGIFVDGGLVCIGGPKDVASRFCGFLLFTISVPAQHVAAARELVTALSPGAALTYSVGGTLKFELPSAQASVSRVFSAMAGSQAAQLEVIDWSVATAGLEEAFIRIANQMSLAATT